MKENKEDEEELIDLDDQNNPKQNKENTIIHNSKTKNTLINIKTVFLFITFLSLIIIIFYFFKGLLNKQMKQKTLIIFDFDKTLSLKDVFEEQRFLLPSKEEQEEIMEKLEYENWTLLMSSFYERIYELNITIKDINNYIDTLEYTPGMIELLQYLEKHKNKYSLVILSAGHYLQVVRMLQRFNLTQLFDEIITIPSHVENEKIIITQGHEYNCDICNVGQCKTFEYNLLIDKFKKKKKIIFDKVYYICDGLNDYCLARNLKENDEIFIRKGFSLYKGLYEKGMIKNISCKVDCWNNGFDIINYFKSVEK